ncbi:MAG: lysophospholipase [Patescibacteria group bacterium]|nr:lysophospholipase [Patescibacteria group bacterium]
MKTFIQNRNNKKISVIIEETANQKGLAFVMHGQGGFKEQAHIQTFADAFKNNGLTVVRFDTRNTIGESEGKMEDASVTSYYQDLEDVINWAKTQSWYQEPFWLAGHSLGGICISLYAEKYPEQTKGLAPISTSVSGKLAWEAYGPQVIEEWKKVGYKESESSSKPGVMKRVNWANMEDILKYNLLDNVDRLTMPVLMIVGDKDTSTPPNHQQTLFEKLPGKKELHIIKGAPHTFKAPEHLKEIKDIFDKWIKGNL